MIDSKLLDCLSCGCKLDKMSLYCGPCSKIQKKNKVKMNEYFILKEAALSFMDYSNFKMMKVNFIFVSMNMNYGSGMEKISRTKDWSLSKNGFVKESSREDMLVDMNIYLEYENLTIGTISRVAAMLSKSDIDKVSEFIFNQKMLISEKEIVSIFKGNDIRVNKQYSVGKPDPLQPVLAEILHQTDLGKSIWKEVVYFDNGWKSYAGSKTFNDGESVIKWRYCKELL